MNTSAFGIDHHTHQSSFLGSPYSSINPKQSTGSQYLPGYLLGNSPQVGSSQLRTSVGGSYNSPSQSSSRWESRSPQKQGSSYTSPSERRFQRTPPQRHSPYSIIHSNMKDKPGAPPTESLFSPSKIDENFMETESSSKLNIWSTQSPMKSFLTPSQMSPKEKSLINKSILIQRQENAPQSPAQIDPFYSQGDNITSTEILDDTAVTVFGFPPSASSYILQQFVQYGTIEKYEVHNQGNWLHIKYQTKIQAKKALSKNGKIYSQTIMIGVLPCIKKNIAAMEAHETTTSFLNDLPGTPAGQLNKKHPSVRALSANTPGSNSPMRNLSSGILSNEKGTPQKKDSVVTKALDYVFGW